MASASASGSGAVPAGWVRRESRSRPGHFYYFAPGTGESSWSLPAAPAPPALGADPPPAVAAAASGSGGGGAGGSVDQVHAAHILAKHRDSRRPSSWRQDNITRSKDEARLILTGEAEADTERERERREGREGEGEREEG